MDIAELRLKLWNLRKLLLKNRISVDILFLFGSQASNRAKPESDIDVCIVTSSKTKDRLKRNARINYLAAKIDSRFEVIVVQLADYYDQGNISPILHEIKTKGVVIF